MALAQRQPRIPLRAREVSPTPEPHLPGFPCQQIKKSRINKYIDPGLLYHSMINRRPDPRERQTGVQSAIYEIFRQVF